MAQILSPNVNFSPLIPQKELLAKGDKVRVICFYLEPGQKINLHTSPYHVITVVLEGKGVFFAGSEENGIRLEKGQALQYEPNEPHGFLAEERLVVMAFICQ